MIDYFGFTFAFRVLQALQVDTKPKQRGSQRVGALRRNFATRALLQN